MFPTASFDDYRDYPATQSKYLDGSYFNQVFSDYPGLIKEPLKIGLDSETGDYHVEMKYCEYSKEHTALLRVVVEMESVPQSARHSSLVLVDHEAGVGYWFEPFESDYDDHLMRLIEHYLQMPVVRLRQRAPDDLDDGEADYCEAYAIKFAHDYLNGNDLDLGDMRSFASKIESEYPKNPRYDDPYYGWEDVVKSEFNQSNGFLDNPRTRNALIGGLGGAAAGALLGGGATGALVGGGLGAFGGYALSGRGGLFG